MSAFLLLSLAVLLYVSLISCGDIDASSFTDSVLDDERVWLVEFYSSMCGGCQEFASTWEQLESKLDSQEDIKLRTGKVSIDTPAGLKVAEELGVLDDGVPNVLLFSTKAPKGLSIVKGDSTSTYEKISRQIKKKVAGLSKSRDGHLVKK